MRKRLMGIIAAFIVAAAGLWFLQRLLMPKYMDDIVEGAMVAEYYDEEKNHDVIFIGDCELYENISPAVLWKEYGINSYIRGSAQQLIWQSYYLMEETLQYEKPKVFVFNVLAMKYNSPQSEAYNRMTLDGMKMSAAKIKSIRASMTEEEHLIDYVFPILRYHSRFDELGKSDIKYFFNRDKVTFNGYYMRVDVKAAQNIPEARLLGDYNFGDTAYYYLDKMVELCENNNIELILVKAPSLYPHWYDEWDVQMSDYASKHNLKYYNFLNVTDDIGLDFAVDTYDSGLHLNLSGAEKLSMYFGNILSAECDLPDRRDDKELVEIWEEKLKAYNDEKDRQYAELENK